MGRGPAGLCSPAPPFLVAVRPRMRDFGTARGGRMWLVDPRLSASPSVPPSPPLQKMRGKKEPSVPPLQISYRWHEMLCWLKSCKDSGPWRLAAGLRAEGVHGVHGP